MNNKEFIAELARRVGYKQSDVQRLVDTVIDAMSDSLQEDNTVSVYNFGTFETKKKLERVMVNPGTGARMLVPPKLVLTFKPNKSWKVKLKGGNE